MAIPSGTQLVDTAGLSAYHDELMSTLSDMISQAGSNGGGTGAGFNYTAEEL